MKALILSVWMLLPNWEMQHAVTSVAKCPTQAEVEKQFAALVESGEITAWSAICRELQTVPLTSDQGS